MSLEMLEIMYGISDKFFLHHLSVKIKCRQLLKNNNFVNTRLLRPSIPNHIRILYQGARDFYKHINTHRKTTYPMKTKWNNNLNLNIDDKTWQDVFKVCFYTSNDNNLVWLQLRILYRILGTNFYLIKIGITPSPICRKCKKATETLTHIFTECPSVKVFWVKIKNHVKENINFNLHLSNFDIMLGQLLFHQNKIPINALILLTKTYIFDCIKSNRSLYLDGLITRLKEFYEEEKLLAILKDKLSDFQKIWETWKPLVE